MRKEQYPGGYDARSRFPGMRLLLPYEGGAVYEAEAGGRFYLIADESALGEFLDPEDPDDAEVLQRLVTIIEFDDAGERERCIQASAPRARLTQPHVSNGADVPQELAEALRSARHIVVLTGAGISAESGIPTFRDGPSGLWARYSPADLASPEGFARDPLLVWEWYSWRRGLVAAAQPNPAHRALARLQAHAPECLVITQNVDDLHERAGSRDALHLHGSIFENRCSAEGRLVAEEELLHDSVPPRCPCGAYVRPGVVWFGEALPQDVLEDAMRAVAHCDLCLVVGTSANVQPAAGLVELTPPSAIRVVINLEETWHASDADYVLLAPAGQVLPVLVDAAFPQ